MGSNEIAAPVPLASRRLFIGDVLKASLASLFAASAGQVFAGCANAAQKNFTVGEIMDLILKEIPGAPFSQTVDTLKSGSREQRVTGIVTSMFATVDIIEQTAKSGANFIIAHEPTFYNHTDDKKWVAVNHIVQKKEALLQQHGITVWRLHDYLHSFKPDSVLYGVLKDTGWLKFNTSGEHVFAIPAVTLKDMAEHLKTTLHIEHLRMIGNPAQSCARIALLPGASGGQSHISVVEKEKPDVLIVGEVHEWETAEYIRDLQAMGEKTALIVLGHSVSEEPGLQWLKEWLQPRVPGLQVKHIVSGNPFTWV